MRIAPAVVLSSEQKETLGQRSRARSLPARVVERSRIVLLAAAGRTNKEIANQFLTRAIGDKIIGKIDVLGRNTFANVLNHSARSVRRGLGDKSVQIIIDLAA